MIKQVHVHVQNKPGRVNAVMEALAKAGINARSLSVADCGDIGIIRLIVDDSKKAVESLRAGFTVELVDVIGFTVPDKPGALGNVMRMFAEENVNIKYLYSLMGKVQGEANIVIRIDDNDNDKVKAILSGIGIKLITVDEV